MATREEIISEIVRSATFAADFEAMRPGPSSRVRNPDGTLQGETGAERTGRLVATAIRHCVASGILVIPDDIEQVLKRGVPIDPSPPYPEPRY